MSAGYCTGMCNMYSHNHHTPDGPSYNNSLPVSSSHGFTSSIMLDFATRAGSNGVGNKWNTISQYILTIK